MPNESQTWYDLPDNYIYISHLGEDGRYFILPNYPDSVQDTLSSSFGEDTPLARTAPVYTYSHSGPRSVQITLDLHRDMMDSVNQDVSTYQLGTGEDYVDGLVRELQAIAVPKYNLNNKAIEVPLVAVRLCDQIFVKGIVNGGVSVTYMKPIQTNGKYAHLTVAFVISEVDPYDATTIEKNGSFRGYTRTMRDGMKLETHN